MNRRHGLASLFVFFSILAGSLGCGSNSSSTTGGTAGTLATAGTGAGTSGTAGTLGTGNAGTTADPNCPTAAPGDGDPCAIPSVQCTFASAMCTCVATNLVGAWECTETSGTSGFGGMFEMQECPAAQPSNGSECVRGRGDCMFGANVCDCLRDEIWACWDPATCPTDPPDEDSACPVFGMRCNYGDGGGNPFGGGRCTCDDNGWSCSGDINQNSDAGI